ncbi:hypothetical protein Micbo1qcDRAFT_210780 [Microdochium bolleyi]|uniref:AMP-dependent synthetase/ligase domain-containing protein n=1 Tax=Microdochium bolleyi TaxID=196109 RepID=A0A136JH71_9PEZI|nr:hypothetical protein Micbo1qcDRAFT_210780 [Microdochium bolleyi]
MEAKEPKLGRSILTGPPGPENLPSISQSFLATVHRTPDNLALSSPSQAHDLYGLPSQPLRRRRQRNTNRNPDDAIKPGSENHDEQEEEQEEQEQLALFDPEYEARPWLRWTYATLLDAAELFGAALARHGAAPGTPVVTFLHSGVESWVCLWACHMRGYTWAPLHPGNLRNGPEVAYMVRTVLGFSGRSKGEDGRRAAAGPVVVLVDNAEVAMDVDVALGNTFEGVDAVKMIAGDDGTANRGWTTMGAVLRDEVALRRYHSETKPAPGGDLERVPSPPATPPPSPGGGEGGDETVIFFSSGSTALPKGCLWQHPRSAITAARIMAHYNGSASAAGADARVYLPLPNNHAAAYICVIPWIVHGGAIVLPSRRRGSREKPDGWAASTAKTKPPAAAAPSAAFDPEVMLRDIQLESCTDFLTVPTMVQALVAANETVEADLSGTSIMMAGAPAMDVHLESCFDKLGVSRVVNNWGMSECIHLSPVVITRDEYEYSRRGESGTAIQYLHDANLTIGTVSHAQTVKVCQSDSSEAAALSVPGELHISSPTITPVYLGVEASNDAFYTDEAGVLWFNTGDEALINEAGQVFLTGRHKEVIVRGGENISPIAIETAISRDPRLSSLEVLVVGMTDDIAGQLPVAVVKQQDAVDPDTVALLHETVLKEMGPVYVPAEVLCLGMLALQDWPRTTIGKIQRNKVAAAVRAFLERRADVENLAAEAVPKISAEMLRDHLKQIWACAVGTTPEKVPMNESIRLFSDSITLMRVRAAILRATGVALTLAEMASADTIAGQLEILLAKSAVPGAVAVTEVSPPQEELVIDEGQRSAIDRSLQENGLGWDDCETLITPPDMSELLSRHAGFNGWAASLILSIPDKHDVSSLKCCLRRLFEAHPLLLSHFARTGAQQAFHVLLKPETHVLEKFVRQCGQLESLRDLIEVPRRYPAIQGPASIPGLVTCAEIFEVRETGCVGLVMTVNHVVVDATYMQIILNDFDAILSGDEKLGASVGYDVWTRAYHSRRTSPEAKSVSDWHVSQLRELYLHEDSIWPLPSPDKGQHQQSFQHRFHVPQLAPFRKNNPEIAPSTMFKAAMVLATAVTIGTRHVAFSGCESARESMPFASRTNDHTATCEAVDIAGPTYGLVFETTTVRSGDKVAQMLLDLQQRQRELTKNATACWHDICSRLAEEGPNGQVNVGAIQELIFALSFNWMPDMNDGESVLDVAHGPKLDLYRSMQVIETYFSTVGGLEVQCSLTGLDQAHAVVQLSGTGLDVEAMRNFASRMEMALRAICQEQNRDVPVDEILAVLKLAEHRSRSWFSRLVAPWLKRTRSKRGKAQRKQLQGKPAVGRRYSWKWAPLK